MQDAGQERNLGLKKWHEMPQTRQFFCGEQVALESKQMLMYIQWIVAGLIHHILILPLFKGCG
jgi:hypothetical protein